GDVEPVRGRIDGEAVPAAVAAEQGLLHQMVGGMGRDGREEAGELGDRDQPEATGYPSRSTHRGVSFPGFEEWLLRRAVKAQRLAAPLPSLLPAERGIAKKSAGPEEEMFDLC